MLLFLPHIVLGAALVFLAASNLFQRGFRSSWLLAVSASALAFMSLLFLRLRLPLSLSFSAWWAGEGLVSSITFLLDEISWQIAFIAAGLVLALFMMEVEGAMSAPWLNWAVNLALATASLFALLSGDLLTFAFFWTLVDLVASFAVFRFTPKPEERRAALSVLPANISASFLLLIAWVVMSSSNHFGSFLMLVSAALRLGVFSSQRVSGFDSIQLRYLRTLPMASVLALLSRPITLDGIWLIGLLVALLLLAVFIVLQSNQREVPGGGNPTLERGFAALALMAAAIGQPTIALAFGLITLVVGSLLVLAKSSGRWRGPLVVAFLLSLSALPYTVISPDSNFSLISLVFLPIHAALISGWSRSALGEMPDMPVGEPWMRVIRALGLVLIPVILALLPLGIAPKSLTPTEAIWWPAIAVIAMAAIFFVASRGDSRQDRISRSLITAVEPVASLRWLHTSIDWMLTALGWVLRMTNRVLEGQAGVLWALLLITLLLSVASQYAFGG